MDATHYWPFAREYQYGMPQSLNTIMNSRSQTSHPQWCHTASMHNFLLQQLSTTPAEAARRNTMQSLHDHIK